MIYEVSDCNGVVALENCSEQAKIQPVLQERRKSLRRIFAEFMKSNVLKTDTLLAWIFESFPFVVVRLRTDIGHSEFRRVHTPGQVLHLEIIIQSSMSDLITSVISSMYRGSSVEGSKINEAIITWQSKVSLTLRLRKVFWRRPVFFYFPGFQSTKY